MLCFTRGIDFKTMKGEGQLVKVTRQLVNGSSF